jgi:hypothetical protein
MSRGAWYKNGYHRLSPDEQIEVVNRILRQRALKAAEEARKRAKSPNRIKPVEIKIPADRRYGVDRKDVGKLWEAALFDQQKERRKAEREEYMSQPLVGKPCKNCGQRGLFCSC